MVTLITLLVMASMQMIEPKIDPIHISASDLVKKSAMQICYLRNNPDKIKPPSEQMLAGQASAEQVSKSEYQEMRGTWMWNYKDKLMMYIHFTFDEVYPSNETKSIIFVEHKMIREPVQDWYINSCIIQVALYESFLRSQDIMTLQTASFAVEKGYSPKQLDLEMYHSMSSLLIFTKEDGKQIPYNIVSLHPAVIALFYKNKAIASLDYTSAKEWDVQWKFKEASHLLKHIQYVKEID